MNLTTNEIANLTAEAYGKYYNGDRDERLREVRKYFNGNADFESRILDRLKLVFPWLLKRAATESDFYEFCQNEGIEVVFNEAVTNGLYAQYPLGNHITHHIFLTRTPRDVNDLKYVMFHEAAHFLFHQPTMKCDRRISSDKESQARKHIEAEIVAAICNWNGTFKDSLTV